MTPPSPPPNEDEPGPGAPSPLSAPEHPAPGLGPGPANDAVARQASDAEGDPETGAGQPEPPLQPLPGQTPPPEPAEEPSGKVPPQGPMEGRLVGAMLRMPSPDAPRETDDGWDYDDERAEKYQFEPKKYRSIFLSDMHLGTRGAQGDLILDFLRANESDFLYLVGDIFDGWQLKKHWYWPQKHSTVIQKLLRKARKGTTVTYIPGNHDEFARAYEGFEFGAILVMNKMVHHTADGRRLLVLHGDEFDGVVKFHPWLAMLGSHAYGFSLWLNRWYNKARKLFGQPYWSLSAYLKQKVKNAVKYVGEYEKAVAEAAREKKCDGIICGHIHKSELREFDGVIYANCGDWVESCTALVEHEDGKLETIEWLKQPAYKEGTA